LFSQPYTHVNPIALASCVVGIASHSRRMTLTPVAENGLLSRVTTRPRRLQSR
jgi:hypothetical protein